MKIRFEASACVGHGRCYALAPEVYDADDQGHCIVRYEVVPPELEEQARAGAANCPEAALAVED
ncbi:ferredoxin [Rhabdothermincola sp.]|uniref:ferredoxin n=1 Tax=Rhabdothermincola sp. TaxID=2820405 RepID=UPI002FE38578